MPCLPSYTKHTHTPDPSPHRQVRSLACGCMSKLFSCGDTLPLYGRVSALQDQLQERDRGGGAEAQRVANMELLTYLSAAHGRLLGSSSLETIGIASKCAAFG